MVTKYKIFESLRDKMKPKSEKEIELAFDKYMGNLAKVAMVSFPYDFTNYEETLEHLYKWEDKIKKYVESGDNYESVILKIMFYE